MSELETENREIEGLLEAMESYGLNEGLILTEDSNAEMKRVLDHKTYSIKVMPIWSWLLQTVHKNK
jgi:hypothetical protein